MGHINLSTRCLCHNLYFVLVKIPHFFKYISSCKSFLSSLPEVALIRLVNLHTRLVSRCVHLSGVPVMKSGHASDIRSIMYTSQFGLNLQVWKLNIHVKRKTERSCICIWRFAVLCGACGLRIWALYKHAGLYYEFLNIINMSDTGVGAEDNISVVSLRNY
jgi:hypothetical protein